MSRKPLAALVSALEALAPEAPRFLVSTGTLGDEGSGHPPPDTLVLAMPISWKDAAQVIPFGGRPTGSKGIGGHARGHLDALNARSGPPASGAVLIEHVVSSNRLSSGG